MSRSNEPRGDLHAGGQGDDAAPSRRGPMVALGVVLLLVVAGILLTNVLHRVTAVQDCVMAGRRNCAPIQSDTGQPGVAR